MPPGPELKGYGRHTWRAFAEQVTLKKPGHRAVVEFEGAPTFDRTSCTGGTRGAPRRERARQENGRLRYSVHERDAVCTRSSKRIPSRRCERFGGGTLCSP